MNRLVKCVDKKYFTNFDDLTKDRSRRIYKWSSRNTMLNVLDHQEIMIPSTNFTCKSFDELVLGEKIWSRSKKKFSSGWGRQIRCGGKFSRHMISAATSAATASLLPISRWAMSIVNDGNVVATWSWRRTRSISRVTVFMLIKRVSIQCIVQLGPMLWNCYARKNKVAS